MALPARARLAPLTIHPPVFNIEAIELRACRLSDRLKVRTLFIRSFLPVCVLKNNTYRTHVVCADYDNGVTVISHLRRYDDHGAFLHSRRQLCSEVFRTGFRCSFDLKRPRYILAWYC